jgi:hypothetical protein
MRGVMPKDLLDDLLDGLDDCTAAEVRDLYARMLAYPLPPEQAADLISRALGKSANTGGPAPS